MFCCIGFSRSITSDDVRDALLQTAYLMLRGYERKRKVHSKFCEGVVTTDFKETSFVNITGVMFYATVECETGKNEISYLVRSRDIAELETDESEFAWVSSDDLRHGRPGGNFRQNPIFRMARGCN
jgi:hypothetical protein